MAKPVGKLFFIHCPKSGRIIGVNGKSRLARILLPVTGLLALGWVLWRVLQKPNRITYPCVQAALGTAQASLGWFALLCAGFCSGLTAQRLRKQAPLLAGMLAVITVFCMAVPTLVGVRQESAAAEVSAARYLPSDPPNEPIGTAKGIYPGRVVWAHDDKAVFWDGKSRPWWNAKWFDQAAINAMADSGLMTLTGGTSVADAWDRLFVHFNGIRGKGDVGYRSGERIVIKVNINNSGKGALDAVPQTIYAIVRQLTAVGVAEQDINVYDASRSHSAGYIANYCKTDFPKVKFNRNGTWLDNQIAYSAEIKAKGSRQLPKTVVDADYIINIALLKRHSRVNAAGHSTSGVTGVSLTAKNQFGNLNEIAPLHESIRDWRENRGMGSYNPLVDLTGSAKLGGKTVLYMIDGLFAGDYYGSQPLPLQQPPFDGKWPCSYFFSQDPVAIDSVGLDFLRAEWNLAANADNYLHEQALADQPPSGIEYKPDGVRLSSLGVHEHWNDPVNRQYSRNLGTGNGIELVKAVAQRGQSQTGPVASPSPGAVAAPPFGVPWLWVGLAGGLAVAAAAMGVRYAKGKRKTVR
jgi:hypothetical protein